MCDIKKMTLKIKFDIKQSVTLKKKKVFHNNKKVRHKKNA